MMKSIVWWKNKYGDDTIEYLDGKIVIPNWFIQFLLNKIGLKSRKTRIVRKVLKREVNRLLREGIPKDGT